MDFCDYQRSSQLIDCLERIGAVNLRIHQTHLISIIQERSDAFVVLPTGAGKSLGFQVAPFCCNNNSNVTTTSHSDSPSKVVIVMPLEGLLKEQVRKLLNCGFGAVAISTYDDATAALHDSHTTHIFLSPEALTKYLIPAGKVNGFDKISHLFIDESHCVVNWGQGDKRTGAFREQFARIGEFRTFAPHTAFIAMTATATNDVELQITKLLQITDYKIIRQSPDKVNIRYSVIHVHGDIRSQFQHVVEEFSDGCTLKTLVFFRQLHYIGDVYRYLVRACPLGAVAMYHSRISEEEKTRVYDLFSDTANHSLRCVLCSSAFSMGMDIPDIDRVIHYGPPCNLDEYIQETGRAGRDGRLVQATMLVHKAALVGSVAAEMKEYVKTSDCRREFLLRNFGAQVKSPTSGTFRCCDCCTKKLLHNCCSCHTTPCDHHSQKCFCVKWCYGLPKGEVAHSKQLAVARTFNATLDISQLREDLKNLALNSKLTPEHVTNVYPDLIDRVLESFVHINNIDDIMRLGALSKKDADDILKIVDNYSERLQSPGH